MAPPEPDPTAGRSDEPGPDALSDLRDRLRATHDAAARLTGEQPRVPPQGWASTPRTDRPEPGLGDELAQLVAVVGSLRELVPPELQQQLTDLIRQVLLLVRAILDRWIERLEPERGSEPAVEDIPIA
jgi:hypothetical protein